MRKLIPIVLAVIASGAFAQRGHVVAPPIPIPGTTVSGVVSSITGNTISLANGLVNVDASQATITDEHGNRASVAAGDVIFAILRSSTSLQASSVVVTKQPQVTLSGTVQA